MKMEKSKDKGSKEERLRKVAEILKNREASLSESQHLMLKSLYNDVQELDFVPKSLRFRFNDLLQLRTPGIAQKLISQDDPDPPCFIVLTGFFELTSKAQEASSSESSQSQPQLLAPGSICGNYYPFNSKHWNLADVVTLDQESTAAVFSPRILGQMISEETSSSKFKSLLNFLREAIPHFENLSGQYQVRLGRFFHEKVCFPGQEIIREGERAVAALLIREGDCKLVSRESPLRRKPRACNRVCDLSNTAREESVLARKHRKDGYISRTTSTYQLQLASAKEWVGDEAILPSTSGIGSYVSSAIAINRAVLLEVSKDRLEKFPDSIFQTLLQSARDKLRWLKGRKNELELAISKIHDLTQRACFTTLDSSQARPSHSLAKSSKGRKIAVTTLRPSGNSSMLLRPYTHIESAAIRTAVQTIPKHTQDFMMGTDNTQGQDAPDPRRQHSYDAGSAYIIEQGHQDSGSEAIKQLLAPHRKVLSTASTLHFNYHGKALCPALYERQRLFEGCGVPKKQGCYHRRHEQEMKMSVLREYNTFRVGCKDIQVVVADLYQRPKSPSPAFFAKKHKPRIAYSRSHLRLPRIPS